MEISDLVRTLLSRRGIETPEGIAAFLNPDYERDTHDPFLFADMDRAVARIVVAIERGERIAVYADFDCDGIPGAALLSDVFKKLGYANIEVYLPHRDREGYGFHERAITVLAARGVSLIITVDVGTTAFAACAHAKGLGVDVIVTDHHEILGALPEGIVINPKRVPPALSGVEGYPFPHLCGAGVAFKLAQGLLREGKRRGLPQFAGIADGWEKWLLDLVAIATVADIVPLVGENRALVFWGLQVLRKSPRPGIVALSNQLRLTRATLSEDDIAFSFAPRINAASRMDDPELALRLLTTDSREEAEGIAARLEELNASRKGVVGSIVREAKRRAKARFAADDRVAVLGDPEWKPALLGLAANSLMEERGGVVCLWGRDATGRLKGSCRSDGSISVVELFSKSGVALDEYGGHAASGGFSVSAETVHTLQESLARAAEDCTSFAPKESGEPDARIALREVAWPLFDQLSQLAPFGAGNAKPLLRLTARIAGIKRFGKEKNHIELSLVCSETGFSCRAFQFFKAPEDFSRIPVAGEDVALLATLERDAFRGPARVALRVQDVLSV